MLIKYIKPNKLFSFLEVEKPTYPLLIFRIGLALICFGKFAILKENFLNLYGQYGLIQWPISKLSNYSFLPHIGDLAIFINTHFNISLDDATLLLINIFFCSCFLLLIGFFTRIAAIICFFLHLAFIDTGNGIIYGVDVFTQLSLFYAMFFPLNSTYSVDSMIWKSKFKKVSAGAGLSIRIIQIQMCIVYLSSGIEKSLGMEWINGEAIWRTLTIPIFKNYDFSWLSNYPIIPVLLGFGVMVIETGYAFAMWRKNLRVFWLFSIILLHLSIGFFMGMWYFALIMILLSVFAFVDDVRNDLVAYKNKRRSIYKKVDTTNGREMMKNAFVN